MLGGASGRASWNRLLFLCSSFLFLFSPPLLAARWARCLASRGDPVICAGAPAAVAGQRGTAPPVDPSPAPTPCLQPPPPPPPTPLCWLLHLSLPLGFHVFTIILPSSFQVLSPLTKRQDLQRTSLAARGRWFSLTV